MRTAKAGISGTSALLNEVARNLKSANPNLRLGVTLYEDDLTMSRFPLKNLDEGFRNSVDEVHLYPHYRKEVVSLLTAVQETKQLFPNSKIIPGVYAYDRRDYLPCARGSSAPCTKSEELNLFTQSLKERLAMLGEPDVEWIEFYPEDLASKTTGVCGKKPAPAAPSASRNALAIPERWRILSARSSTLSCFPSERNYGSLYPVAQGLQGSSVRIGFASVNCDRKLVNQPSMQVFGNTRHPFRLLSDRTPQFRRIGYLRVLLGREQFRRSFESKGKGTSHWGQSVLN